MANSISFHRGEGSTSAAGPLVEAVENITVDGDTVVFDLASGKADFPFSLSDYHLTIHPAKGDSIEMLALVDQNARTTALVSGDVDAIDLKTVGLLERNQNIMINSVAGTQHFTFAMSTNQAPFDDNNLRLALKYAIDWQEMVDKILFGYGSVGNDVPIGSGQLYYHTELEQKTFDPDKAKFYLKQAGLDRLEVSLSAADAAFAGTVDASVLFQNSAKAADSAFWCLVRNPSSRRCRRLGALRG